MRQFDVVPYPLAALRRERPFVVVIQTDDVGPRDRRVVAPLVVGRGFPGLGALTPRFVVEGSKLWFLPFDLAVAPIRALDRPVANLEADRYAILRALDMLFSGV